MAAFGLYLVARFMPPLSSTRRGRLTARAIDALVGAATTILALDIYLAVRAATEDGFDSFSGFDRDTAVAPVLVDMLWQSGLVLAGAGVLYLLASAPVAVGAERLEARAIAGRARVSPPPCIDRGSWDRGERYPDYDPFREPAAIPGRYARQAPDGVG